MLPRLAADPAKPRTTDDPQLRLLVAGRLIKPMSAERKLLIFMLPRGASEVRLVSRAAAPSDTRPWLEDRRRLGVRVARLVVRGGNEVWDIALDHPSLAKGWWAVERDGIALRRWTDGNAALPLPVVGEGSMLEVGIADTVPYVAEQELALASYGWVSSGNTRQTWPPYRHAASRDLAEGSAARASIASPAASSSIRCARWIARSSPTRIPTTRARAIALCSPMPTRWR